jgi:tetratricopeptide (TPR) repeat protein
LAGLQASFGDEHWRTLMARIALADELGRTNPEAARVQARLGYEGLRSLFGEDNLMTRRALKIYGTTISDCGDLEGAVELFEGALAETEGDDFERAQILALLAENLHDLGRLEEAEALYLEALELHEGLGSAARDLVLMARHNLAVLYQQSGRFQEALGLELAVVAERERVLGLAHPDSRGSLNNLALIYEGLRRPADEEAVRRRKLAAVERDLGLESPEARQARDELGTFLRRAGREDEARALAGPGH